MDEGDHPMLQQLADLLPSIIIRDRAPKTIHTYLRAFKAWKIWVKLFKKPPLPVEPRMFVLYIVKLIQENKSVSTINTAVYGVSWVQKKVGQPEVSENQMVKQVVDAARRLLSKPPDRKKPLKVDQVLTIISRLESGTLSDMQLAALFALGFFGFLRWDDLSSLRVKDLLFADSHVAIFLEKRKNDQFREGSWVFVARCSTSPCPVSVVEKFIEMGKHSKEQKLFCKIQSCKKGQLLRNNPMTYSRANECIKEELKKQGLDGSQYGIHSLRSGGASSAAALQVPDRLFQRQGGWRSEKAKNNYVEESLDSLLLVTKTMHDKR